MWKILRGGATVIPGATFIPESRVVEKQRVKQDRSNPDMAFLIRSVELVDSDSATVKTHLAYSVLRGEEQVSCFFNYFLNILE